jgi:NADPH-dependent F420 reductase
LRVAILGGTGSFGRALGQRLLRLEHEVAIGSRDPERARELGLSYGFEGGANEDVVGGADLVVLATRSGAAIDTARALAGAIGETPLLCVASDLHFDDTGVTPGRSGRSIAEEVADLVPGPVAAGFQSLAAAHLLLRDPPEEDVFVCGEETRAKELSLELGSQIVAGRAIDAGPLANARALEGMTSVILNVNKRYRSNAGIRLTGLP